MKALKKDYTLNFMNYGTITVPAGELTNHNTALGYDENYNFVCSFGWIESNYPTISCLLLHDVKYYGINVPSEYLED